MMKVRALCSLLVLVLLVACSPAAQRQELVTRRSVYVGRMEADLVREMGVPTRTYEAAGSRFLAYASSRTVVYPGAYGGMGWGYGGWGYGGGWGGPAEVVQNTCEATFEVRDLRVIGVAVRGSGC